MTQGGRPSVSPQRDQTGHAALLTGFISLRKGAFMDGSRLDDKAASF
jgi:hypothetical protein